MSAARALAKLLLGETWALPLGIGCVLLALGLLVKPLLGDAWSAAGGPLVLLGVALVLVVAVARSARRG